MSRRKSTLVTKPAIADHPGFPGESTADWGDSADKYHAGLDAANPNNRFMRRRQGMGGTADAQIPPGELRIIRDTVRHAAMNDALIGQMMTRLADNIVQAEGFRFVPQTGDVGLDRELTDRFKAWGENPSECDFHAQFSWHQLEWLAFLQQVQDGDIFGMGIEDGSIQMIEADRCESKSGAANAWGGVIYDAEGRVVRYSFLNGPVGPRGSRSYREVERFDGRGLEQVWHLWQTNRVTQHRGYSWLAPLLIKCGMLDDLEFATIVKAQSAAAHALFFEQDKDATGAKPVLGTRTNVPADGGRQMTQEAINYGMASMLPKGVKVVHATAAIPNAEHFQHVRHHIREIGAGLAMPLEMILLDASQTNYSGWRGAMDQARMTFRREQKMMAQRWHRPIWKWKVAQWAPRMGLTALRAQAAGLLDRVKIVPPSWPYVNPLEDAQAADTMVRTGQDSPRGIVAKRGGSYEEVIAETVEDRADALRAAHHKAAELANEGITVDPLTLLGWNTVAPTTTPATAPKPKPDPTNPPARDTPEDAVP